ncbi:MAG: hypothetical protein ACU4EQ_03345 [Candidatus Nitrosoglobus sp.]|jgi:hypothetical protein
MANFDNNNRIPQALLPTLCMCKGNFVESHSGVYQLILQDDSNLVLYKNRNSNSALWASGTYNSNGCCVIMQPDGNLVIYDHNWQPIWASNTSGNNGSWLIVQDDGNAVIYKHGQSSPNGAAIWASNTGGR